jgi:hypothetical protein
MRDRRAALTAPGQKAFNGIDYVEVDDAETRLVVHFLVREPDDVALKQLVTAATITGGDAIPAVAVTSKIADGWSKDAAGRPQLELRVAAPGDFSTYTLQLGPSGTILDPYFDHVAFSFKAGCPSTLDCETPAPVCALPDDDTPPIDYLAKDFQSFRKALSDFSALRYPAWQERSEADFGVMFMEALASLADDLSYQQDRIAAEAWIETATQRRSLVRLARLVDYDPLPATAARTWLRFELAGPWIGTIPTGLAVSALAPDGTVVEFETGTGLDDRGPHAAASAWNRMAPYWWDDAERCLAPGTTAMWIEDPGVALVPGQRVLIDTAALDAERPVRKIVRLTEAPTPTSDPLFGKQLLRLVWGAEDALERDHDLTRTTVAGNLVPATQGRRYTEQFATKLDGAPPRGVPRAIVRTGANRTPQYLYTLGHAPLTWLAQDDPEEHPRPELRVTEVDAARWWSWRRSLLDGSLPREVVTVDPVRYRTLGDASGAADYDGADGDTIRFGDGAFGAIPADGTIFEVTYRAGAGTRGNVAAGAINRVDPAHPFASTITAVDNPLAAEGGQDEEPADRIRELAPQRFRAKQFRAVRAEDYDLAAKDLPWVQRAGTAFRDTGSWVSVFTAVDPRSSESVPVGQLLELTRLLDRRRLAGYEAFGLPPRYASFDLDITVCARSDAFRGDVKRGVLAALDTTGFFHPDRFSFGVALERSALEVAIQDVPGVDGVVTLHYRRRGHTDDFVEMPDAVEVGKDEIARVDNNPSRPERGSLRVAVMGGK